MVRFYIKKAIYMGISLMQLIVILLIILLLFGAGKLPQVMSQLGKGLRLFKNSLEGKDDKNDDETK